LNGQRKYHHGNLKEAFLEAAREVLEADGLTGLSLRKTAEKIGVSHTAPKNHFGSMSGLLTALVTQGYAELADYMVADETAGADRCARRGTALAGYVDFAMANPALYELMFARDRLVNDDPDLMRAVGACFSILADVAKDLGWHTGTSEVVTGKSQIALWSFVHGYAQLITAGRFKKDNMKNLSVLDILPAISAKIAPDTPE
jgi:AcrR family transcriptional regulator